MSGPMSALAASAVGAVPEAPAKPGRRPRLRHLWLIPGLTIAILGSQFDSSLAAIGVMVAFGMAPHLAFLAGIGQRRPAGQMAPRAVAVFNAMHQPILPAVLLGLAATGVIPLILVVGGTAWLSHIVIGWGVGDGKRNA